MPNAIKHLARGCPQLHEIDISIAPESYDDGVLAGPRPAMVIARNAASEFLQRVNDGADCFALTSEQRRVLWTITGQRKMMPWRLLASCLPLRLQLTTELIEHWRNHWRIHNRDASRQYMSVTIITDSGNTLARRGHADIEALRRRAYKLLCQVNLHGVFVIEVQLLTNFPRHGHGGTHCWHVHCVATTDDPNFDIETVQTTLRGSGRLSNIFDAPTVTITPIETLGHLMRACAYMLKAPAVGKRLAPHPVIPKAWTLEKVFIRKDEALRLVEALSQVQLGQIVHSVGLGKHILRPAMKALRELHKTSYQRTRKRLPVDYDMARYWAQLRNGRAGNRYDPYDFSPKTPWAADWEAIARKAFASIIAHRERLQKPLESARKAPLPM